MGVNPQESLVYIPSVASVRRLVEAYGDPRTDVLVPGAVTSLDDATRRRADEQLRNPVVPQPEE